MQNAMLLIDVSKSCVLVNRECLTQQSRRCVGLMCQMSSAMCDVCDCNHFVCMWCGVLTFMMLTSTCLLNKCACCLLEGGSLSGGPAKSVLKLQKQCFLHMSTVCLMAVLDKMGICFQMFLWHGVLLLSQHLGASGTHSSFARGGLCGQGFLMVLI